MKKIATFDDWIDAFRAWQKEIDLRLPAKYADYPFEAKYGDVKASEIEYGDFAGERKWERVTQIPHQPIRDALLNLIVAPRRRTMFNDVCRTPYEGSECRGPKAARGSRSGFRATRRREPDYPAVGLIVSRTVSSEALPQGPITGNREAQREREQGGS